MTSPLNLMIENLTALDDASREFAATFFRSRGLSESVAERLTCSEANVFADLLDALGHDVLASELLSAHYFDGDRAYNESADHEELANHWDRVPLHEDGVEMTHIRDERIVAKRAGWHDEDPDVMTIERAEEIYQA